MSYHDAAVAEHVAVEHTSAESEMHLVIDSDSVDLVETVHDDLEDGFAASMAGVDIGFEWTLELVPDDEVLADLVPVTEHEVTADAGDDSVQPQSVVELAIVADEHAEPVAAVVGQHLKTCSLAEQRNQ